MFKITRGTDGRTLDASAWTRHNIPVSQNRFVFLHFCLSRLASSRIKDPLKTTLTIFFHSPLLLLFLFRCRLELAINLAHRLSLLVLHQSLVSIYALFMQTARTFLSIKNAYCNFSRSLRSWHWTRAQFGLISHLSYFLRSCFLASHSGITLYCYAFVPPCPKLCPFTNLSPTPVVFSS